MPATLLHTVYLLLLIGGLLLLLVLEAIEPWRAPQRPLPLPLLLILHLHHFLLLLLLVPLHLLLPQAARPGPPCPLATTFKAAATPSRHFHAI